MDEYHVICLRCLGKESVPPIGGIINRESTGGSIIFQLIIIYPYKYKSTKTTNINNPHSFLGGVLINNIDGIDQWSSLKSDGSEGARREVLQGIDSDYQTEAIIKGKWKLVKGNHSFSFLKNMFQIELRKKF